MLRLCLELVLWCRPWFLDQHLFWTISISDIGYLFQDLEALRNETRSDLEEDSQATIDYASQNENDSTFAGKLLF